MREIKFRVWDSDESKMIYPAIEHNDKYVLQLNCEYIGEFNGKKYDSVKMPLMQFTGLKDKNGREIYEGDIIQFKVDFPDQEFDNGVVRWADGGYWTSQTEDDLEELLSEELSDLPGEVIGNIYENPELVTPK